MDTDHSGNEAREVLAFRLGQEEYGVDILAPDQIKPAPQISSLISTDYVTVTGLGMVEDRMIILADIHQLASFESAPLPETADI